MIPQLFGVCVDMDPVYAVMEYMLHGDLKNYLLSRRGLVYARCVSLKFPKKNPGLSGWLFGTTVGNPTCVTELRKDKAYLQFNGGRGFEELPAVEDGAGLC